MKNYVFLSVMLCSLALQAATRSAFSAYRREENTESHRDKEYSVVAVYALRDPETGGAVYHTEHPRRPVVCKQEVKFGKDGASIPLNFVDDETGQEFYLLRLNGSGNKLRVANPSARTSKALFISLKEGNAENKKERDLSVDLSKACYGFKCAGMFSGEDGSDRS